MKTPVANVVRAGGIAPSRMPACGGSDRSPACRARRSRETP
jgi:hypothetical protein